MFEMRILPSVFVVKKGKKPAPGLVPKLHAQVIKKPTIPHFSNSLVCRELQQDPAGLAGTLVGTYEEMVFGPLPVETPTSLNHSAFCYRWGKS